MVVVVVIVFLTLVRVQFVVLILVRGYVGDCAIARVCGFEDVLLSEYLKSECVSVQVCGL